MIEHLWFWLGFGAFILAMLALDLGVFHRKAHVVSMREAVTWTCIWVTLATLFGWWIWSTRGSAAGIAFYTGYIIELSLSADNVFVFSIIFGYFAVPKAYQHKVLFWGVLSALVLRLLMILSGVALVERFIWLLYIFGVFLLITGIKMLFAKETKHDPEATLIVKLFRRFVPTSDHFDGDRFLTTGHGRRLATPLLLVLVCVEVSDVVFAVDSIPAIFAITRDPFIVFTSNVFAIMGLRSLYFLLAEAVEKFYLLRPALGIILAFVGGKMLLGHTSYKIPSSAALAVVLIVLFGSVVGSIVFPKASVAKSDPDTL